MPIVRLRIALADRSGALAQAATVVGLHGGNIRSIDVHRSLDGRAVDDLIVDFADPPRLAELAQDLDGSARTAIVSCQPAASTDPVVVALSCAARLLGAGEDVTAALASCLGEMFAATRTWTATAEEAGADPLGRSVLAEEMVAAGTTSMVPPADLVAMGGREAAALAVGVRDRPPGPAVVYAGRSSDSPFTLTEVARAKALLAVLRSATMA